MNIDENKTLAFWGTGNIAHLCLKQFPHIRPEIFIDSNAAANEKINGISVKKPQEIMDWKQYFILVATSPLAFAEIEVLLMQEGLVRGRDYADIPEFYGIENNSSEYSLLRLHNYLKQNDEKDATLIFAPVFTSRISDTMFHFFRSYCAKKKSNGKCILFTSLYLKSEAEASADLGIPVFSVPQLCYWIGKNSIDETQLKHEQELTLEEKEWVRFMEERKISIDEELAFRISSEIYWYCKNLFALLNPKEVIIWGQWIRLSYILEHLSAKRGIAYGFMEHGWIPGTFQFEHGGIAGQSEYAVCPDKLLNLKVKSSPLFIRKIRSYICQTELDNGKFKPNSDDEASLRRIDKNRKTVFLIGMGDHEMCMNAKSAYWYKYISSLVSSAWESVLYIADFCEKNGWNFVFKPHPSSIRDNGIKVEQLPQNVIFVKDMKIDRLIKIADIVVSIASAADYKALIYGKPLVSLGHTTLHGKNCCYEPQSVEEIETQMRTAMKYGMTEEQNLNFEKHMAQLLENYLWDDLRERELRYGLTFEKDFFE